MREEEKRLSDLLEDLEQKQEEDKEENMSAEDLVHSASEYKNFDRAREDVYNSLDDIDDYIEKRIETSEDKKVYYTYDGKKMGSIENAKDYNKLFEQLENQK